MLDNSGINDEKDKHIASPFEKYGLENTEWLLWSVKICKKKKLYYLKFTLLTNKLCYIPNQKKSIAN